MGYMPTILVFRNGKLRIKIGGEKGGKHHEKHCHIWTPSWNTNVSLETLRRLDNGHIDDKDFNIIMKRIIKKNLPDLLEAWDKNNK